MSKTQLGKRRFRFANRMLCLELLEHRLVLDCSMIQSLDALLITGDASDNSIQVRLQLSGDATVVCDGGSPQMFSSVRRIEVNTGAGDDNVKLIATSYSNVSFEIDMGKGNDRADISYTSEVPIPPPSPIPSQVVVKLAAGEGDDFVNLMADSFFDVFTDINLGGGSDKANLTFVGGGTPDPGALQLKLAAGAGNDEVNLTASSFFDVFFDMDLGAGNDRASVDIPTDPLHVPGKVRELLGRIAAGAGDDVAHSCIPMSFFDVFVEYDLGAGNDVAELELEVGHTVVPDGLSRSIRVNVLAGAGNDTVQIDTALAPLLPIDLDSEIPATEFPVLGFFDVFLDLNLGQGNDQAMVEFPTDPSGIAGKVRELHVSIDAGAGDDVVKDCEPMTLTTDVFLDTVLGAGNDVFMLEQQGGLAPVISEEGRTLRNNLSAGTGDDMVQVLFGRVSPTTPTSPGFFNVFSDVDLGAGNDEAKFDFVGLRAGDGPSSLRLNLVAAAGNDKAEIAVSSFTEVSVDAKMGAGDDRFALDLDPNPLPFDQLPTIVQMLLDMGHGTDGVVLDVQHVLLTDILVSISIIGVGLTSVETLFPLGLLELRQATHRSMARVELTLDGLDVVIDVATGISDDLIKLETDLAADGSVRFSAVTGGGNDSVNVAASSFFDVFTHIDLGSGNDKADLAFVGGGCPDPGALQVKIAAGAGDDEVSVRADSFFDVFADVDLGVGNDKALVELTGIPYVGPRDPYGLVFHLLGGEGDDVIEAEFGLFRGSALDVVLDGGRGNDVVHGKVRGLTGSEILPSTQDEIPVSPVSALRFRVLGSDGNDLLALTVDDVLSSSTLLDLLLDGGRGIDHCTASLNVEVINCEDSAT